MMKTLKTRLEEQMETASSLKQEKEEERDQAIAAMEKLVEYEAKAEELMPDIEELADLQDALWRDFEVDIS